MPLATESGAVRESFSCSLPDPSISATSEIAGTSRSNRIKS